MGKKIFGALARRQMFSICSIQNSTCPGQFSTHPAQNTLALVSGRALVSLTAEIATRFWEVVICPIYQVEGRSWIYVQHVNLAFFFFFFGGGGGGGVDL